jgi:phosphoglucomutase
MERNELIALSQSMAKRWLSSKIDENTRNEIQQMLAGNEDLLVDSFYTNLEFGTGGLRGIMGAGTNRMNIYTLGMATQGLANYLKKQFSAPREIKVAIAHDCRNNSRLFAETTAHIFSANGFKVYLFESLRPTPELSYAIRHFGCQSGVVITASHNPKQYNGYKAYWDDGGQVVPPHDIGITEEVQKIKNIEDVKFDGPESNIISIGDEIDRLYIDKIAGLSLSPEIIRKQHDLKIVYTAIHGTGVKLVPMALKKIGFTNVHTVAEQNVTDGNFPTVVSPNPEEPAALAMALAKAKEIDADILLGTDPDADRVGIAVKDNHNEFILLNGNQTGALLFNYLLTQWKEKGLLNGKEYIVKTIVTTELIADIARKYGIKYYDVLTGFKYIAEIMRENEGKLTFICGAEESYGYLVEDFVRDKDAISACAMLTEAAAWAKDQGKSFFEQLLDIYVEFGYYKEKLSSVYREGQSGAEEIKKMMQDFRNNPPSSIGGAKLVKVHDYLLQKTIDKVTGSQTKIKLPKSNVLQFVTQDGSIISIRPSGTEPKIKFYFGVKAGLKSHADYERVSKELDQKIGKIKVDLKLL